MWKETIICIVIVLIIIVGNTITQNYTVESVSQLNGSLMELKHEMENGEEDSKEEKAKNKIDKTFEEWENRHSKLAYFIEHDELEKVEDDLTSLKSYIGTNEFEEAISQLDKCAFVLKHIQDKYAFNLENIF